MVLRKIEIPLVTERFRGITLPVDNAFYVCDYNEVFKVTIGSAREPEILDDDPYQFLEDLPHSLGVYNHPCILESNGNRISYNFDPPNYPTTVHCYIHGEHSKIDFITFSGDWFAASFSPCGSYLVLAEPYSFDIYAID